MAAPFQRWCDPLESVATDSFIKTRVATLSQARLREPIFWLEGVSLETCNFRNFSDFEQMRFVGSSLFRRNQLGRQTILTDPGGTAMPANETATIYRELRQAYEKQGNRPGAADFYYGEMNARIKASFTDFIRAPFRNTRSIVVALVVGAYWLMSGYAQRPMRSISLFIATALAATQLFLVDGFGVGPADEGFTDTFQFSVQSMLSFFSPPEAELNYLETWLQIALRFIGPALLAQTLLGVREHVAR